jgi:DVNP family
MKIGTKRQVAIGKAGRTVGGLRKKDITRNTRGKYVSVKQQKHGQAQYDKLVASGRSNQFKKNQHTGPMSRHPNGNNVSYRGCVSNRAGGYASSSSSSSDDEYEYPSRYRH